jgi:uncharacterized protein YbjQ (UPF0145 family)
MSDQAERDAASQASIIAGGLPLNAIDRLREQASRQGKPGHIFTSDLSVNELLLTRQCGFESLGQVMGSSVYHVGWAYMAQTWGSMYSGELTVLTEAYYSARHLAFNRLRQEAKLLGADGVVGVRLTEQTYEWGSGLIEFAAIGTAVRRVGSPPMPPGSEPFVSNLSGQDHFALRQGGWKPVGFAFGNCTWLQFANWKTYNATSSLFSGWQNQELSDYTQAQYAARELAMERMSFEAQSVSAQGVVGVTVEASHNSYEPNENTKGLIVHFTAFGTCIAPDLTDETFPDPIKIVSLEG